MHRREFIQLPAAFAHDMDVVPIGKRAADSGRRHHLVNQPRSVRQCLRKKSLGRRPEQRLCGGVREPGPALGRQAVDLFRRASSERWLLVTTNAVVMETHALLLNRVRDGRTVALPSLACATQPASPASTISSICQGRLADRSVLCDPGFRASRRGRRLPRAARVQCERAGGALRRQLVR